MDVIIGIEFHGTLTVLGMKRKTILIRVHPSKSAERKLKQHPRIGSPQGFQRLAAFFCSFTTLNSLFTDALPML